MIKGFRFTNQLANAEIDARIHQEFLNKNDGIFYGMELDYTNSSITISEGLCEIAGRPVAVIDNETVAVGTENLYCLLILEIDLSKDSTKDTFNQASFKLLTSSTNYPNTTQQDINMYNGSNNLYQLEFARFKSGTSGISEFKDTRQFLSFTGIYAQVKADCDIIINQIKQELENVKDGSVYLMKEKREILLDNNNARIELIKIGNLCRIIAYSKGTLDSSYSFSFNIPSYAQKEVFLINRQTHIENPNNKVEINGFSILGKSNANGYFNITNLNKVHQYFYNEISYYID